MVESSAPCSEEAVYSVDEETAWWSVLYLVHWFGLEALSMWSDLGHMPVNPNVSRDRG